MMATISATTSKFNGKSPLPILILNDAPQCLVISLLRQKNTIDIMEVAIVFKPRCPNPNQPFRKRMLETKTTINNLLKQDYWHSY